VHVALDAAALLEQGGWSPMVINPRFLKPLDEELLALAASTGRVVTIEEHVLQGSFGSAAVEWIHGHARRPVACVRIGIPDEFVEHGPCAALREKLGLTPQAIVARVRAEFAGTRIASEAGR